MANNLCVFAKYKWWMGYKQYPSTNYSNIYSELFTKAGKQKELIVVSVKDNNVLYAYRYKMSKGCVWLCFQHDKICDDFEGLFSFFNSILNSLAEEGIGIITKTNSGKHELNNINFKDPKLKGKLKDFLRRTKNTLETLLTANSVLLPQSGGGDITDEVIEYELINKGSAYFVERIKERYTVILLQEDKKNKEKKKNDWSDFLAGAVTGILLFNLLAPWFSTIPTWLKFTLVAITGLGMYFVGDAFDDNSKRKNKELLGWIGAFAILLSTILTIYGICEGFSKSQMMSADDIFSDAVERKDTSILKVLVTDSAYDKAIVPLANIYLENGKEDVALRYAEMADTTTNIEARSIIKTIVSRKKGLLETQIKDIVDNLSDDINVRIEQLHKAKRLQDSVKIIAEPAVVTYSISRNLTSKIDEDFNVWVETGDNSPIPSVKISCYENALRLKEDKNISEKLDLLKGE